MGRELKFRAYDTFKKEFIVIGFSIIGEVTVFNALSEYSIPEYNRIIVEQFTGLKDKNGKEIYEGDKLVNHKSEIGTVVWYEAGFHLKCPRKNGDTFFIPIQNGGLKNKTIIGNIHENDAT